MLLYTLIPGMEIENLNCVFQICYFVPATFIIYFDIYLHKLSVQLLNLENVTYNLIFYIAKPVHLSYLCTLHVIFHAVFRDNNLSLLPLQGTPTNCFSICTVTTKIAFTSSNTSLQERKSIQEECPIMRAFVTMTLIP